MYADRSSLLPAEIGKEQDEQHNQDEDRVKRINSSSRRTGEGDKKKMDGEEARVPD